MRIESRIFLLIAVFCFAIAGVYGFWTNRSTGAVEVVGVAALILSGGLCFIIGTFFSFVARRIDLRPEDRPDAEIAEGAGELGFFSPGSYWPIGIAAAATVTGMGLAFGQLWLAILGVSAVLTTVGGLLFEYYIGANTSSLR
ncbi:MAG: cytochrome c oxidase subunit 4 [Actinomycetota bacterium]|nr:cytochrome c oxidase subunit 4 [Actinomycetota bacterium]